MPHTNKSRFWRRCRVCFRWCRIVVWLLILGVVGALAYLNQVGLPGFIKRPLLEKLRVRGIDLQFSRLRLRWYHGIVAENVRLGPVSGPMTPQVTLAELQVRLNHRALRKFQLQVDSLLLRQGRLVWPIAQTNGESRQLSVEKIQTELRLLPDDQWALDDFKAQFHSVNIRISGAITNASFVREWKVFHPERPAPASIWQERLRQFADLLERIQFSAAPDLRLAVTGDARDLQSFSVRLAMSARDAATPWGELSNGLFTVRVYPATNQVSRADMSLDVAHAQTHTQWPAATNLAFSHLTTIVHGAWLEGPTNPINADLHLTATEVHSDSSRASNVLFTAHWTHSQTNVLPVSGHGNLSCEVPQTPWGHAQSMRFALRLAPPAESAVLDPPGHPGADASWGWWAGLEPYVLDWDGQLLQFQSPRLEGEELACRGTWRAPMLAVDRLYAKLYEGQFEGQAALDVPRRALNVQFSSDFEPQKITPLLAEKSRQFLDQFTWQKPPQLSASVAVVLPAWTNRAPEWREQVLPTLRLDGKFKLAEATFRAVPAASAQSHFSYSNGVWRLPDLWVTRPEGQIEARYMENERTKEFHWRIHSSIDPAAVRPLLDPKALRDLDLFFFTRPPVISAEVWGRWHDSDRTGLKAQVSATNFAFRGEIVDAFETALQYTNRVLQFSDACLQRGTQQMSIASLILDLPTERILLTNGFSTTEPMVIARAIGPQVVRAIEPYRFQQPPVGRVEGVIPLHGETGADLTFDLAGGGFHWSKFNMSRLAGIVHWLGQRVTLTRVRADCYGGAAAGAATFDFSAPRETYFSFALNATNTQLSALMADLVSPTNRLEGLLSGSLTITNASTSAGQTWNGGGNLSLRDGLIWDIPIFGVFSPVLNGLVPGLGNSRASAAAATYSITNGVIRSDDLDIRCSGMRLAYRGTVDFKGQVNARVEAALLRDAPLVGPILSTVFWPVTKLFEYKVTGSLGQPNTEPLFFIPKVMLIPFHPLRTLKELFPEEPGPSTNGLPPFEQPK